MRPCLKNHCNVYTQFTVGCAIFTKKKRVNQPAYPQKRVTSSEVEENFNPQALEPYSSLKETGEN